LAFHAEKTWTEKGISGKKAKLNKEADI